MNQITHTVNFISKGTQTKRVVRISRIRPDMPRHKFQISRQFVSNNGTAMPCFSQVLRDVDNVLALHVNQHAGASTICIGLPAIENLNPLTREKHTPQEDQ